MLSDKFTRIIALGLILSQSYAFVHAVTDISQREVETGEILGPNGEPLFDFLFVEKDKAPVTTKSTLSNNYNEDDVDLDELLSDD